MATITEDTRTAPIERDTAMRRAGRRSRFYLGLALACAVIAILGFAPTYWLQLPRGTFQDTRTVGGLKAIRSTRISPTP